IDMWTGDTFWLEAFLETGDPDYLPTWAQGGYLNATDLGAGYGGKAALFQEGRIAGDEGFVSHSGSIDSVDYSGDSSASFTNQDENSATTNSDWLDFEQGLFYSG
ncbi:MAG: hypothetical protein ACOC82_02400, partial [Candidatus Bipolaricaulota bacterium]